MAGNRPLTLSAQLAQQNSVETKTPTTSATAKKPLTLRSQLPATQTGAQNAPRSAGTSVPDSNNGKRVTGKAADSGYTVEKKREAQQANRQTVKDWWKKEQAKAAEDDSTERARTAKLTGGANIDNSEQFLETQKERFSGFKDSAKDQRDRALASKMGQGENWSEPKGRVGNAIESAVAGTVSGVINAVGTVLQDDGKRQGLAVDSSGGAESETTGNEWYNRAGRYLQNEADKVKKISEEANKRGSEGLNNAQKLLFDVGVAGLQMAGDIGVSAATGGVVGASIPMALRGFGSAAMEAREGGASHTEQVLYGAASAAVEVLTEKVFDGVAHIYGKGAADDVVQKLAEKLAKTKQGQSVIRTLINAGGEGLEEMISGAIEPALQTIYNDKVINGRLHGEEGAYDDVKIADILYEGVIGMLLGFVGGSVDMAQTARSGGYAPVSDQLQGMEGNKKSSLEGSNTRLTADDTAEYMGVGERQHVRNSKDSMVAAGDTPILTTVESVKQFIKDAASGKIRSVIKAYGKVGSRFQGDVMKASDGNTDISGYYLELDANRLAHLSDHVDDTDPRNIPLTEEQMLSLPEYIDSYDDILSVDKKKDGGTRIKVGKRINGHSVVVVLASKGRRSVQPVTAWINTTEHYEKVYGQKGKKTKTQIDTSQASALADDPSGYKPVPSDDIVPDSELSVKDPATANPAKYVATNMDNETKNAFFNMRKAKRKADRVSRSSKLTAEEKDVVSKMLKGELAADDASVDARLRAVYEARKEYEDYAKKVADYRKQHKADLRSAADADLAGVLDWKDKTLGLAYSRETMERNIRDITPDKATADNIIRTYFTPVHEGEAAATRMKNSYRERVAKLGLSRKVAKGNKVSEAAAVQILGEAESAIALLEETTARNAKRDGKTLQEWRGIVEELWRENPKLNKDKIAGAADAFREIYEELIEQMNEVRVRNGYEPIEHRQGYFPHFQNGEADGLLKALGKALGVETEVTQLPTSINGLTHTFRPGIRWFGHAQERQGYDTVFDAVEGFDRYIEGAAGMVHQTDNIQRLRALSDQIRYRSTDEGIREQIDAVRQNTELAEEDKQNRLEKIYENGRYALGNFVVELEEYTNQLANKKSRKDRDMEQALGRKAYTLMKNVESRVAANMVAVNPASWLTNFIPITQGWSSVGTEHMLAGMWDTLRAYKEDDGFVGASTFLTNRRGSDPLVRTWVQEASAALSKPMEYIDSFTADTLVRGRYLQNKEQGLSDAEAMREADSWAAGVMADRSKGATPTIFNAKNPVTKVFTQFQLEVNNQLSYLVKDLPEEAKEKGGLALAAMLTKFFVGAFLYNELYEYVIGRRPALDPIGILNDTVGDITGRELPNLVDAGVSVVKGEKVELKQSKPEGTYAAVSNLAGNVAESLPFVGGLLGGGRVPISSALPNVENLAKAAFNENWSEEKRAATLAKELAAPATYLVLPFGGGQLKKIYQGIKAVQDGGSYSVDADGNPLLQYPVYNDTTEQRAGAMAKAVLFGKSSLKPAQEWVEGGFDSFSAKETAVYQGLGEVGVSDKDAYELIRELGATGKTETESANTAKRSVLRSANISGEGKSVIYYGMMATDKERKLMDDLESRENMGFVTEALMKIREGNLLSGEAANQRKLSALIDNRLSTSAKLRIYSEMINEDTDAIEDALSVGIDFDDIMVFKIMTYGLASDSHSTKKEKVLEEINRMDLSTDQKDELYFMAGYKESTLKRDAPWW